MLLIAGDADADVDRLTTADKLTDLLGMAEREALGERVDECDTAADRDAELDACVLTLPLEQLLALSERSVVVDA